MEDTHKHRSDSKYQQITVLVITTVLRFFFTPLFEDVAVEKY